MTIETNIKALRESPGFAVSLLPDNPLIKARAEFDNAGRCPDPANWAKAQKRLNKANNLCARLVRQQYYPIVKSLTLAFMKDYKLSAEHINERDQIQPGLRLSGQISFDVLYHLTVELLGPAIRGSNAFLHIANAIKPMILKALKELQTERVIVAHKPRRRAFGKSATYELIP